VNEKTSTHTQAFPKKTIQVLVITALALGAMALSFSSFPKNATGQNKASDVQSPRLVHQSILNKLTDPHMTVLAEQEGSLETYSSSTSLRIPTTPASQQLSSTGFKFPSIAIVESESVENESVEMQQQQDVKADEEVAPNSVQTESIPEALPVAASMYSVFALPVIESLPKANIDDVPELSEQLISSEKKDAPDLVVEIPQVFHLPSFESFPVAESADQLISSKKEGTQDIVVELPQVFRLPTFGSTSTEQIKTDNDALLQQGETFPVSVSISESTSSNSAVDSAKVVFTLPTFQLPVTETANSGKLAEANPTSTLDQTTSEEILAKDLEEALAKDLEKVLAIDLEEDLEAFAKDLKEARSEGSGSERLISSAALMTADESETIKEAEAQSDFSSDQSTSPGYDTVQTQIVPVTPVLHAQLFSPALALTPVENESVTHIVKPIYEELNAGADREILISGEAFEKLEENSIEVPVDEIARFTGNKELGLHSLAKKGLVSETTASETNEAVLTGSQPISPALFASQTIVTGSQPPSETNKINPTVPAVSHAVTSSLPASQMVIAAPTPSQQVVPAITFSQSAITFSQPIIPAITASQAVNSALPASQPVIAAPTPSQPVLNIPELRASQPIVPPTTASQQIFSALASLPSESKTSLNADREVIISGEAEKLEENRIDVPVDELARFTGNKEVGLHSLKKKGVFGPAVTKLEEKNIKVPKDELEMIAKMTGDKSLGMHSLQKKGILNP